MRSLHEFQIAVSYQIISDQYTVCSVADWVCKPMIVGSSLLNRLDVTPPDKLFIAVLISHYGFRFTDLEHAIKCNK